jgi:hypothetical protein
MTRDFGRILRDINGKSMVFGDAEGSPNGGPSLIPATLGRVAAEGLLHQEPGEKIADSDKLLRWMLAGRVVKGGVVDLTIDELALVRSQIGKRFVVSVAGPAFVALEAPPPSMNDPLGQLLDSPVAG